MNAQQKRAQKKCLQAVRAQIHQVHRIHWHRVSPKFLRRLAYWAGVYTKWSNKYGVQASFKPRRPRGKRALVYAAFLARQVAVIHDEILLTAATTTSPAE